MSTEEFTAISALCPKVMRSIDEYQNTAKESDRLSALEQVNKLARALEKPGFAVYKIFFSVRLFQCPAIPMAVKTAADLGIFTALSATTSFVTCDQLAASQNADEALVDRIMRVLVCNGFASERGPREYTPTKLSKQMTDKMSLSIMDAMFVDFFPIIQKTPDFFKQTGYKNPEDPKRGPLQYAYNTPLSCWDWLAQNPEAMDRFNTFMEGHRADAPHWADWFPVKERLIDGAVSDRPLVVDVAGGRGHDLAGLKERIPVLPGDLVLEELPAVIDDIHTLDESIRRVKYDFFKPQPIKGARAYYFKHIMHDWSDENCRRILKHTINAMERGYSKVLIEDHVVPDQNAGPMETLLDMIVMTWCPGNERTRTQWTELLGSVGLSITKIWLPDGLTSGIIEAELRDLTGHGTR
ncbi:S-adenosyl-L-methionine-dependent methyltransferase [Aspergillus steynii IBT 23096]|uniref:S-adenosyl-L-methionine-dependent methyltransferase n=1 Tax=Aspergillus steynii IBT 23096 TaxID=1392250 RepID=A0A2I2GM05_9EURO|nr:S-adenosyl-L-methionine-dependent methyltransferase [Aspergillus steynii IBT 23096]PLB53889.1 S-adenosyl-L-methionine-dependent methyltransferase [Aspergillus steynii IBT 23096]